VRDRATSERAVRTGWGYTVHSVRETTGKVGRTIYTATEVIARREGRDFALYGDRKELRRQIELSKEGVDGIKAVNIEEENRWLLSFPLRDKRSRTALRAPA